MSFKEKILDSAETLFTRFGLRSVTMDDIASDLSISKKTLYGCVKDKKELVLLTMTKNVLSHKKESEEIFKNISHPIDQMSAIFDAMYKRTAEINPSVFKDLQKSHPKAFHVFNSFREDFIFNKIKENLNMGVSIDLYRDDMDIDLITNFYIRGVDHIILSESNQGIDVVHKQYELMNYHLRGIVTEKGLEYLKINPINHGIKI
jgi:predicted DNA-binding protein YlxM (UPF0122 family)